MDLMHLKSLDTSKNSLDNAFKLLKEVFCDLKSQYPLNSKLKCPRLNVKKDLSIDITFGPC
jgi:hypothetical protein